ncbi:MAG: glycosyltransferase [Ignavibacteriales bacterium]|nr:glycosyltransferase [Ignavibacteriales bacterium]
MTDATKPLVTVGMPVYNGGEALKTALTQMLAQTHANLEVLVSDNQSTDGTEAYMREIAERDSRVRYVRQPENIGQGGNFTYVLENATGEYFSFAAHDDRREPFFVESALDALQSDNEAVAGLPRFYATSKRGRLFEKRKFKTMDRLRDDDPYVRVASFLLDDENAHKCNFLYGVWKREALLDTFRLFQKLIDRHTATRHVASIDTAILSYALSKGKFVLADRLGFYKAHRSLVYDNFLAKLYYYVYRVYRFFFPVVKSKGKKYVDILDEWRESATGMIDAVLKETTLEEYQRRHILEEFRRKYRNKPIGN